MYLLMGLTFIVSVIAFKVMMVLQDRKFAKLDEDFEKTMKEIEERNRKIDCEDKA